MKKLNSSAYYFIVPLIALAVFTPYYLHFSNNFDEMKKHEADLQRQQREAKLAEDDKLKAKAIEDANAAAELRKKQRAEKEAADRRRVEERETLIQTRDRASNEVITSHNKVSQLTRDVQAAKDEITKVEADEAKLRGDEDFLKIYVAKTEANQKKLTAVLEKIAAADAAVEAAAKAAAAAKK